jgi:hypothetical protein
LRPCDPRYGRHRSRIFELRRGGYVSPGGLEPGAPGGGKFGLGVIEGGREADDANRGVLRAVKEPQPFVAVDRADADFAAVDLEMVGANIFAAEFETHGRSARAGLSDL